jgi:hypothetical protein
MGVPMGRIGGPFQWLCGPPPYWIGEPASNGPKGGPICANPSGSAGPIGSQWHIGFTLDGESPDQPCQWVGYGTPAVPAGVLRLTGRDFTLLYARTPPSPHTLGGKFSEN